jgi:hypothetical protein
MRGSHNTVIDRGLMINLVRVFRSLFSDAGGLYMNIQECEAEVKKEADLAQKQGC